MITVARKSWKNMKGKSERVWPYELEVALVKGKCTLCVTASSPCITDAIFARFSIIA
jgi:hypothetical protein